MGPRPTACGRISRYGVRTGGSGTGRFRAAARPPCHRNQTVARDCFAPAQAPGRALGNATPRCEPPQPPADQPLVTIGGGGPLPLPIGNGSLPAPAARLSAATAVTTASRNTFIV